MGTLKYKIGIPAIKYQILRPVRFAKDLILHYDWRKMTECCLFEAVRPCDKKEEFGELRQARLHRDILRPPDRIKAYTGLRKSRFYFLEYIYWFATVHTCNGFHKKKKKAIDEVTSRPEANILQFFSLRKLYYRAW